MAVAKETVDLAELEKQFSRFPVCSLCQSTFNNPKILPCFHSFCLKCLKENRPRPTTGNLQGGATANCPTCRADFLIPRKGVADLPTNVFVESIIAAADALSSILQAAIFQRTDGRPTGRGKSPMHIGRSIKNFVRPGRVSHEDGRQSCASDKTQQKPFCKTHRKKFDSYCNNCTQVMCHLCNGKGHSNHLVISVDSANKDLLHKIDSYLVGVDSCHAYCRGQNDICETAREGRTSAATMNRMDSTPVRQDDRGRNVRTPIPSSSISRNLSKHPETNTFLDSWKECTKRFFKIITNRGLHGDILNIAKELHKLHETCYNLYEQESPVQQSQNTNSPSARNSASRRDGHNRSEFKEKERGIHQLHSETIFLTRKVSQDKKEMLESALRVERELSADLQNQLTQQQQNEERRSVVLERLISWIERIDTHRAEFQMTTGFGSDNGIIDKLQDVIVNKIKDLSEKERLLLNKIEVLKYKTKSSAASEQMTQQMKSSNVALKEHVWSTREKQFADKIQLQQSQIDQLQEDVTKERESNRTAQWELEAALRKEGHLTAELADFKQRLGHGMVDNKQVNHTGLLRELKNLVRWIEREDRQLTEGHMTTEGESDNIIIKKIKASIIKTTKELRDKKKQLLQINEDSGQQINDLKQILTTEEKNHRTLAKEFARERDRLIEEIQLLKKDREQLNAKIQELENQIHDLQYALTQQKEFNHKAGLIKNGDETSLKQHLELSVAYKKELSLIQRELEHLIQWVDTIDEQSTDQITLDEKSQNGVVQKLKSSVTKKTKELKTIEKQLLHRIDESDRQITKLKQSLYSEQQKHQELRNSNEKLHKELVEKERIRRVQEKQLNDMGNENFQLREVLKQQVEPKKSFRAKLDQVSPTGAEPITEVTKLKQQRLNTKNNFDDSTAVQIVANLRAPTGIRNMGNTCFFGATIQNLVYTVLLTEELPLNLYKLQLDTELPLTKAYIEFRSSGYETKCDETFRHMFKTFCKKSSRFADRGQHDSHDLFVNFLNCLRDEERRRLGSVNSPGFRNVLTTVDKVFGGHTITVYVCSTCKTPYHVCEPFLDISVPILGPKDGGEDEEEDLFVNHLQNPQSIGNHDSVTQAVAVTMRPLGVRSQLKTPQRIFQKRSLMPESTGDISLKQCLVYYSRTERIHNEYLCNPCEAKGRPPMTSALKRTLIYNPPAVLVLHLKRFEQTTVGFKKCNQRVTYEEYLDIGPYCSSSCLRMREPDDANIWYSLYGVVVHKGSLTSGHYVAYIKVKYCDTPQTKQFMQQTFLNRDQVLNEDDIRRINASRGMVRSRKEWEPKEVDGQWYLADDEYVKAVEKTEALSQEAYLLFYERVAK